MKKGCSSVHFISYMPIAQGEKNYLIVIYGKSANMCTEITAKKSVFYFPRIFNQENAMNRNEDYMKLMIQKLRFTNIIFCYKLKDYFVHLRDIVLIMIKHLWTLQQVIGLNSHVKCTHAIQPTYIYCIDSSVFVSSFALYKKSRMQNSQFADEGQGRMAKTSITNRLKTC